MSSAASAPESSRPSYAEFLKTFTWESFIARCDWPANERYNIAHEMVDRWANDPATAGKPALRFETKEGERGVYSFSDMQKLTNQAANMLASLGIKRGDRVGGLLSKNPAVLMTMIGTWKLGAVYVPLFTAFAAPAVAYRLRHSQTKLVVTDTANVGKVRESKQTEGGLPDLEKTLVVGAGSLGEGEFSFSALLESASSEHKTVETTLNDLMVIQYTSGSTGNPKGAMLSHRGGLGVTAYTTFAMDVRPDDVFWGAADPGWAYGSLLCLPGPMLLGNAATMIEPAFSPELGWQVMERYGVTNFTFAPTGYRAIVAAGPELMRKYKVNLRVCTSAGEPLNPEVIDWFKREMGVPVYDCYGQTETLMTVCNCLSLNDPVKPGSMGRPLPGFDVNLVNEEGQPIKPGEVGQIALNRNSFCYSFMGYLGEPDKTDALYNGDWHLSGDMARLDEDGYFWFEGRSDDLINTSGYRVGPFEIESALLTHPAVAEAAVIGIPDPQRGETIKAYVTLKAGQSGSDALVEELQQVVRKEIGKHAYPRSIEFTDTLPKTPSGKIQRYLLRRENL